MWKISTTQVSAQSRGGKSSRWAGSRRFCGPLVKRQGKNVKPCHPRKRNARMPFPFCPFQEGLRGWDHAGSHSFLRGSGSAAGQVLVPQILSGDVAHASISSWVLGSCKPPGANILFALCPSLPALCRGSVLYTLSSDICSHEEVNGRR